jgi:hypothetical protein
MLLSPAVALRISRLLSFKTADLDSTGREMEFY